MDRDVMTLPWLSRQRYESLERLIEEYREPVPGLSGNWRGRVPAEVVRSALVPPIPIMRGTLILPPLTCGQIDDINAGLRPLPTKPTRQIPPISAAAYDAIKRYC